MYEVTRYWDDDHPEWDAEEHAFAAAWRNQPKWVVSRRSMSIESTCVIPTFRDPSADCQPALIITPVISYIMKVRSLQWGRLTASDMAAHGQRQCLWWDEMERMTRRQILVALSTAVAVGPRLAAQAPPSIRVFRDPTCGCCGLWVEHLRKAGFAATVAEVEDIGAIKTKYGVPPRVSSCHTALVGNYVLEGHVPAEDIRRLLKEGPDIAGIGVPGMPIGSPGMEVAGMKSQAYDVLAFDKKGTTRVFSSHGR